MNENDSVLSEAGPETRLNKFTRGTLRWVLVGLLAFATGALIITFALYVPTRQKLDKTNDDLENANAMITAKSDQITILQTDNKTLHKA